MKTELSLNPHGVRGEQFVKRGFLSVLFMLIGIAAFSASPEAVTLFAGPAVAGEVISRETPSVEATKEASPELLMADVQQKITLLQPDRYPFDTFMQNIRKSNKVESQRVEWYEVSWLPFRGKVTANVAQHNGLTAITIDNAFAIRQHTVIMLDPSSGIKGRDGGDLVLFVESVSTSSNTINVQAANGAFVSGNSGPTVVPAIPADTEFFIGALAKNELDMQADAITPMPQKEFNYCQMFMTQIEEGDFYRLTKKEVEYGMPDFRQQALFEFRARREGAYLNGFREVIQDATAANEKYLTGGVRRNMTNIFDGTMPWSEARFVDLTKAAFVGNNGSDEKFLFAGSELIATISKIDSIQKQINATNVKVKWGVRWTEIETNFGLINLKYAPIFNQMFWQNSGMIIDPDHVYRHVFTEETRKLDLKNSGQKRAEVYSIMDTSCVSLRNTEAHMFVQG